MIRRIIKKAKSLLKPQRQPNPLSSVYPLRKINNVNCVFVHINKTGGTSVAHAINLPAKRHLTVKNIINEIGVLNWEQAYKFTVVRNPWDKVVSHYKYRQKTNQTNLAEHSISFKEWVIKSYGPVKDKRFYDKPKMFQPQVEWLKDFDDRITIDQIMHFEKINEDFKKVSDHLGLAKELPHLNKTVRKNYKAYYDEETKKIVEDWFKEDIAYFGYTF